jgi:Cu/Ag efflux pump CusA
LAVLAALLVAVTVTPALASVMTARGADSPAASPVAAALSSGYRKALEGVLARRRWAAVGLPLALLAGLTVLPPLGGQPVLPIMQDRNLLVHWEGAPGTSQVEMNRIITRAGLELRATPGVRDVGAHVGRAVAADQVVEANAGEMWVSLHSSADYAATTAAIRRVLAGYSGLAHRMETYPQARVREVSGKQSRDLVVRVYGQDQHVLRTQAEAVRRLMVGVDGIRDPAVDLPAQEPTLEVQVNLAKAQRYGLKPGDVRRAAAALLSGIEVGNLFEQQKLFDVIVVGAPSVRHSVSGVADLLIETPNKGQVRLGALATVRLAASRNLIRREAVSPFLDVAATVSGRDRGAVVRDIKGQLLQKAFPIEYHAEVLAASTSAGTGGPPLYMYVIAALIAVFLLLQAATGSWRLAGLLVLAIPLALSGALLAAEANGGVTALSSFAGLLTVLGLTTRWVLVIVRDLQREHDPSAAAAPKLVAQICGERLHSMVMTTVLLAAAMAPFAVLGTGPGYETLQPIAVMVLGGLVSALLLALFVVPALYLWFGSSALPSALGVDDVPHPRIDLTRPIAPTQEALL